MSQTFADALHDNLVVGGVGIIY